MLRFGSLVGLGLFFDMRVYLKLDDGIFGLRRALAHGNLFERLARMTWHIPGLSSTMLTDGTVTSTTLFPST
jgi:hypothetical protein